jgi:Holliday junction resolvase
MGTYNVRFDGRRDRNEKQIVDALRSIGCLVMRLPNPDLLAYYRERYFLIEVKTKTGRSTKKQQALVEEGWDLKTATCVAEAIAIVTRREDTDPTNPDAILKGLG